MTQTQATTNSHPTDSFASMFEASETDQKGFEIGGEGQIVAGIVVQVNRDTVVVDIGGKSEGIIHKDEFIDAHGEVHVKPGDRVDVFIESRESDDGLISMSKEKADKMKVWDEISSACERDEIIEGTISQRVKGGLSVTIRGGVKAFLPGSQVDLRPIRNLEKLIGQTYEFKVIKFNKKRGNIVLSRRVLLEKERDAMKAQTLQNLEEGMVLTGTIRRNAGVLVKRNGQTVHEGRVGSLKRFKEDVTEVKSGFECGIGVASFDDVHEGDILEVFEDVEVARRL